MKANTVSTIGRRLSAVSWNCAQRGTPLSCKDRAIATMMAGIRNRLAAPPVRRKRFCPKNSSPCWRASTGQAEPWLINRDEI
jgi:hypothetical protein